MSEKRPNTEHCFPLEVISLFPEMFDSLKAGVIGRAITENRVKLNITNPRQYSKLPNSRVDDRPYGGGPGMVMCYEPLAATIEASKASSPQAKVIHLSPRGKPLQHDHLVELSQYKAGLIIVCSRYEGIDERLRETHIDEEYSIGDFVVSGGELPAMLLIDGLTRLLPGVLGDSESAMQDSFCEGLLDHSHYTRPATVEGLSVPKVLISGDHSAIARFRAAERLKKTWQQRPDLLKRCSQTNDLQAQLDQLRLAPLPAKRKDNDNKK